MQYRVLNVAVAASRYIISLVFFGTRVKKKINVRVNQNNYSVEADYQNKRDVKAKLVPRANIVYNHYSGFLVIMFLWLISSIKKGKKEEN